MAQDGKYGRVNLEHGSIGEDEPVVVFRGQDSVLPALLDHYYVLCRRAGSPQHHLDLIKQRAREIEAWQEGHFHRVPNSDAYFERIGGRAGLIEDEFDPTRGRP